MSRNTLTILLAGGRGARLDPLTRERAKPAVPFAGGYRIVDFPLSNCINSGLNRILVLPQYKSLSLDRHLEAAWKPLFSRELGSYLEVIPPQQRISNDWYRGTADAVFQNLYTINQAKPDDVLILAGDHISSMDYRQMLAFHLEQQADVTIGAFRVSVEEAARQFGVIQVDREQRVRGFQEKPALPTSIPGDSTHTFASMGIYIFKAAFLEKTLCANAARQGAGHDFGHNILPAICPKSRVFAFPFRSSGSNTVAYWKDVGTLDAYFDASQQLLRTDSPLQLDDEHWPLRTFKPNLPPPQFLSGDSGKHHSCIRDSIVCSGSKLVGASISKTILGYQSVIALKASLEECVVLGDATIGRNVRMRRVIIDKHAHIPDDMEIGLDHDLDESRGFTISQNGVTVVPRGFDGRKTVKRPMVRKITPAAPTSSSRTSELETITAR